MIDQERLEKYALSVSRLKGAQKFIGEIADKDEDKRKKGSTLRRVEGMVEHIVYTLEPINPRHVSANRLDKITDAIGRFLAALFSSSRESNKEPEDLLTMLEEIVELAGPVSSYHSRREVESISMQISALSRTIRDSESSIASRLQELAASEANRHQTFSELKKEWDASFRANRNLVAAMLRDVEGGLTSLKDAVHQDTLQMKSSVQNELSAISDSARRREQDIASLVTRLRESVESDLERLSSSVSAELERLESTRDRVQTELEKASASRDQEFKAAFHLWKEGFDAFRERSKKEQKDLVSNGEMVLSNLEQMRGRAERLSNDVAGERLSANYKKQATAAKKAGFYWQLASMVSVGLLVLFTYFSYRDGLSTDSWPEFANRLLVAISLGGFAALSIRRAERNYRDHFRLDQYALELACLEPYLEGLSPESKELVKRRLAHKFFGNSVEKRAGGDEETPSNLIDLLKSALDLASNTTKRD